MRRRVLFFAAVAIAAMVALPSLAFGILTNEYGMTFAGQARCLGCHAADNAETVHGRFAKKGLVPDAPEGWTTFKAAGTPEVSGTVAPGSGKAWFASGGSYAVDLDWITLGDFEGGAATEYLFFNGNTSSNTKANPWNLVEGLIAEPTGEWMVGSEDPEGGLFDVVYGCQRCHMLGTTTATPNSTSTAAVPNPSAGIPATYTTPTQWAREDSKTAADFRTDAAVAEPGMSIQCEACHGTGWKATGLGHWGSGTQLSHRITTITVGPTGQQLPMTNVSTIGQSQVCGQCHGSYTNVAGTLGIYGYTPNLPLRNFVNINGVSGGNSYTYTPTEAEFMANPTAYWLFPNGSNAKGSHYYYNEWSTSGHAYRGALTSASPDAMRFQADGAGHFNAASGADCNRCHTGEGYLDSKDDEMFEDVTVAESGFMGQECIVCHDSHPAAVGAESNIRTGDAAGVRSNAGLSTANASLCEDCHNWQFEVQGTSPVYKPLATIASRGGPSHPQRETLHGKVMLEIPVAGEFMPGAECQECHMPKTNKAANRFSHGMHIMEPGEAEEWMTAAGPAYQGEDSCSGCHAGETRSELQANLEEWQDDTSEALALTGAAITAAQTGGHAEYSLTDTSKPGYVLVGRATWNYKSVGSDGSAGAHNPEYVLDGLAVAKKMALSVGGEIDSVTPATVGSNQVFAIAGNLENGDDSDAVDGTVSLYRGATLLGETKSDANGNFSFQQAQTAATTYTVRWKRSSQAITDLSENVTVGMAGTVVGNKIATSLTLSISKNSAKRTVGYVLSGEIDPAFAGAPIIISYKRPGETRWRSWTTVTTDASGDFRVGTRGYRLGTYKYRATFPGDATHSVARYVYDSIRIVR